MYKAVLVNITVIAGMLALMGCTSKVPDPDKYSGFLSDYSNLQEATSVSGKAQLRWVDPGYDPAHYDSVVYHPVIYYPAPEPTTQVGQNALDQLLNYTNVQMKKAIAERKPLVTTPGPRSLIFRGAITAVDASQQGLKFYEVVPVALAIAGMQMATGYRTHDTRLYFEGELIDNRTGKPVVKVVRKGEGENLSNKHTPLTADTLKAVVDDMAIDAVKFDPTLK